MYFKISTTRACLSLKIYMYTVFHENIAYFLWTFVGFIKDASFTKLQITSLHLIALRMFLNSGLQRPLKK